MLKEWIDDTFIRHMLDTVWEANM